MKQTLHILTKDLRRYSWAWIILIACAGISVYLEGTTAGLLDHFHNEILSGITSMVGGILFFVVIVMVVQEETLADPDAYWLSRPIRRGSLLASKLLFLFFLLGIFLVAEVITLVLNDGAGRIPFAFSGVLLSFAIWQAQVFLAAQTRSLPRYLLLVVLVVVGFYALTFVTFFIMSSGVFYDFPMQLGILPAKIAAHWLVLIQTAYWLLVGIGLLMLIYYRRRIRLAWILLLPAAFAALFLTPGESFLGIRADWFAEGDEEGLRLDRLQQGGTMHSDSKEWVELRGVFEVKEKVEASDLWISIWSLELSAGGEEIKIREVEGSQRLRSEDESFRSISLGYLERGTLVDGQSNINLRISMDVALSGQIPVANLPIREGSAFVKGGNRLVVTRIYQEPDELEVRVTGMVPTFAFEPRSGAGTDGPFKGKFSFALTDQAGGYLEDFRQNHAMGSWSGSVEGRLEVPFNEDADIDDFGITVYERVVTESFSDFIDVSGVSFQR